MITMTPTMITILTVADDQTQYSAVTKTSTCTETAVYVALYDEIVVDNILDSFISDNIRRFYMSELINFIYY